MYTLTFKDIPYEREVSEEVVEAIPVLSDMVDCISSYELVTKIPIYFGDVINIDQYPYSIQYTADVKEAIDIVIDWCEHHVDDMLPLDDVSFLGDIQLSPLGDYDAELFDFMVDQDIDFINYVCYIADYLSIGKLLSLCFNVMTRMVVENGLLVDVIGE